MRFSLVTVTRNNLSGLLETYQSIESQNSGDYEWLVIDGASTDGTIRFLQSLPPQTCRWVSEADRGIYDAMNKGLRLATGEYILFLNAGDMLAEPDTLKKLSFYESDFIYGDSWEGSHYKRARSHRAAVTGMFTHHQAMAYRRILAQGLSFDASHAIAADYKFTLQHLKQAMSVSYFPTAVCRFTPGGVSQTNVRQGRTEQFRIRRELAFCPAPVNIAIWLAQTAIMALRRHFPALYWRMKRAHNSSIQKQ